MNVNQIGQETDYIVENDTEIKYNIKMKNASKSDTKLQLVREAAALHAIEGNPLTEDELKVLNMEAITNCDPEESIAKIVKKYRAKYSESLIPAE